MYTYSFEKLEVWVEAKELSKNIYLTTKQFPDDEKTMCVNPSIPESLPG